MRIDCISDPRQDAVDCSGAEIRDFSNFGRALRGGPIRPQGRLYRKAGGAMPADHGVGLHDDEDVGPPGPQTAQGRPEQPVKGVQLWARPFASEHGNLLSEGENLNCSVMPTAEENAERAQEREDEFDHEHMVVACRNAASAGQRQAKGSGPQAADSKIPRGLVDGRGFDRSRDLGTFRRSLPVLMGKASL